MAGAVTSNLELSPGCITMDPSKDGQSMLTRNTVALAFFSLVGLTSYGNPVSAKDMTTCLRAIYAQDESNRWPRKEALCSCWIQKMNSLPMDLALNVCDDQIHGDIRRERERARIRREERLEEQMLERYWDSHEKQMEQIHRNWGWTRDW